MEELSIKGAETSRWDCVSLGEVMLRLDPGEGRIHTARQFQAWEGIQRGAWAAPLLWPA
jgi:2-dehydro-3-deoxygluconokinase